MEYKVGDKVVALANVLDAYKFGDVGVIVCIINQHYCEIDWPIRRRWITNCKDFRLATDGEVEMKKYFTILTDSRQVDDVFNSLEQFGFREFPSRKHAKENLPLCLGFGNGIGGYMPLYQFDYYLLGGRELVTIDRILNNPETFEGATPPEKTITIDGKEFSESTIKAALREYVG